MVKKLAGIFLAKIPTYPIYPITLDIFTVTAIMQAFFKITGEI